MLDHLNSLLLKFLKELQNEWNEYSRRPKIVLSIYALLSLPLMPFYIVMIPFAHWITTGKGMEYRRISIGDFLSMAMSMSFFVYLFGGIAYCTS